MNSSQAPQTETNGDELSLDDLDQVSGGTSMFSGNYQSSNTAVMEGGNKAGQADAHTAIDRAGRSTTVGYGSTDGP